MTVVETPSDWVLPNQGPQLVDFVSEISLTPGIDETITVGMPEDPEGHSFYVKGWEIEECYLIPWVMFLNETSQTSI